MSERLNLEKQLCFYGAYHHNPTNVAIHMICVPIILLSSFLLATNTPSLFPMPAFLQIPNLPPNFGTIATIGYCGFYILLEPIAGGLLTPLLLAATAYSNHLTSTAPHPTNQIAGAAFVISWIAQFIGHGKFEGRAPALLDNLVQALVLAPFFVWMEVLFKLGYRPELQARVEKAVQKEVEKYRNSRANGSVKNGKAK